VATTALTGKIQHSDAAARSSPALRRVVVFVVGGVLNLLGVAAWLVSGLLTAPLLLAGVGVWAREFDWAERLLTHLRRWTDSLWRRANARPARWGIATALSLTATTTAYWWLMS
jgi:uncharacterized membrane protein YbaN (DUF454 family)